MAKHRLAGFSFLSVREETGRQLLLGVAFVLPFHIRVIAVRGLCSAWSLVGSGLGGWVVINVRFRNPGRHPFRYRFFAYHGEL